jgi:hypothetical protein
VNIRHLRAAYALVDPAHHVSEDALAVVVELQLHRLVRHGATAGGAGDPPGFRLAGNSRVKRRLILSAVKSGRPQGARTPPPGPCLGALKLPGGLGWKTFDSA